MATIPSDPLFAQQLYLRNLNAGQFDLNIVDVWDDYTGAGVQVTVLDNGFDLTHADLDANFLTDIDYDYSSGDDTPLPGGDHGTSVAGIIGAEEGNSYGGVGVAWDVDLVGYRGFAIGRSSGDAGEIRDAAGLGDGTVNPNGTGNGADVMNVSGGEGANVFANGSTGVAAVAALADITTYGRGGLGTNYVKSSGNSRASANSINREEGTAEQIDSSEFSINAAALRFDGWVTNYSSPGANVLVSAFADNTDNSPGIVTTDRTGTAGYNTAASPGGDFTTGSSAFDGTSAAAPQVAGVVALMMEANDQLGWRDVQQILAYSARNVGSAVGAVANTGAPGGGGFEQGTQSNGATWFWNDARDWNGGAMHFSNDYGYGLVDAKAAVRLAETWDRQSTSENQLEFSLNLDPGTFATSSTLQQVAGELPQDIIIEYVTVNVDFSVDQLGDIELFIVSPDGTRVQLLNDTGDTQSFTTSATGWDFGTNAFRGTVIEGASDPGNNGDWAVQFRNDDGAGNGAFTITDIDITFTGRAISQDDLYVFTEEYSNFDGVAGHVTSFNGGTVNGTFGTFNAAAVSSNTTLDFLGNTGTIDGVSISAFNISKAYTGDGNDTVTGDTVTRLIFTGRGNDTVNGGSHSGGETINGGTGNDTINGGDGNDIIIDGSDFTSEGTDTIDGGAGNDLIIANYVTSGSYQGGSGTDTLDVRGDPSNFAGSNAIDLSGPTFSSFSSTLGGFENAITGSGGDSLLGSSGSNTLIAGAGSDTIDGGAGSDRLLGDDTPFGMMSMNLDGVTDQYLELDNFTAMPESVFTVEWLFRATGTQASSGTPFVSYGVNSSTNEFLVFGNTGGTIDIYVNGVNISTGVATADVFDGDAHRMSVAVNTGAGPSGRVSLYIDGVEVFSGAGPSGSAITSGGTFILGQDQDGTSPGGGFDPNQVVSGEIGDVRVWGTEREEDEVAETAFKLLENIDLMDNPALVANWQVNPETAGISNLLGGSLLTKESAGGAPFTAGGIDFNGGNDSIEGGSGSDTIFGGGGNDTLNGGSGSDKIFAGAGNDVVQYLSGQLSQGDEADGGEGIDTLFFDVFSGGGNGTFNMETGVWSLFGSDLLTNFENFDGSNDGGNFNIAGTSGDNTILTGSGNDSVDAGDGFDSVNTGDGNDRIVLGDGDDIDDINGGNGVDLFDASAETTRSLRIDLDDGTHEYDNDGNEQSILNIENVTGGGGNDHIIGNAANNILVGAGGDDVLEGLGGNDLFDVVNSLSPINDTFDGGAGTDTIRFNNAFSFDFSDMAVLLSIEVLDFVTTGNSVLTLRVDQISMAGLSTSAAIDGSETGGTTEEIRIDLDAVTPHLDLSGWTFTDWNDDEDSITVRGDASNNTVTGSVAEDLLTGNDGDDSLNGGAGDDVLSGGAGADSLVGGSGIDVATYLGAVVVDLFDGGNNTGEAAGDTFDSVEIIAGGLGAVDFRGDGTDNTLIGGLSGDTIRGRAGSDSMDGGGGVDLLRYLGAAAGVTVDFFTGTVTGGDTGDDGDTFVNFENFLGTGFDDSALGDDNANVFETRSGNDFLRGNGGNDRLDGGGGADIFEGGSGADTMLGGAGDDQFRVADTDLGFGTETVDGGSGTDTLAFTGNDGALVDMRGHIVLGIERLQSLGLGTSNSRTLALNASQFGGTGISLSAEFDANGNAGAVTTILTEIDGQSAFSLAGISFAPTWESSDIVRIVGGSIGETITGSSQRDTISGEGGNDTIDGGAGNDSIEGGTGDDVILLGDGDEIDDIDGGAGIDTFDASAETTRNLRVDIGDGTHEYDNDGNENNLLNMENAIGGAGDDELIGDAGANTLTGGAGDDIIEGAAGADVLEGGAGNDTLSYAGSVNGVRVDLGFGTASNNEGVTSDAEGDTFSGFENIMGSASDDRIGGDAGANTLDAGDGNDILDDSDGADVHLGGIGDDSFQITDGSNVSGETYDGGSGTDELNLFGTGTSSLFDFTDDTIASIEGVRFLSTVSPFTGGGTLRVTSSQFGGFSTFQRLGGSADAVVEVEMDTTTLDMSVPSFTGFAAGDSTSVTGTMGADTIVGSALINTIAGLDGNDSITGGNEGDSLGGGSGEDSIVGGTGNDTIFGNADNDRLDGGGGADSIRGGGGDDLIFTTRGDLSIDGSAGDDVVIFDTSGTGTTSISGGSGVDTIESSAQVWSSSVTWDLAAGTRTEGMTTDTFSDFEHYTNANGGSSSETVLGSGASNNITILTTSSVTVDARAGDDTVTAGSAGDSLDGGDGSDTISYQFSAAGVLIDLSTGFAFGGDANGDTLSNFESVIGSNAGNDSLAGSSGENTLAGMGGDDTLEAGGGTDSVDGGAGNDTIIDNELDGTGTADTYDGGDGIDTLIATGVQWGPDVIFDLFTGNQRSGAGFTTVSDVYANIENLTVNGSAQIRGSDETNVLIAGNFGGAGGAGSFANTIDGEGGDDTIDAGEDNDSISGGDGHDSITAGSGNDTIDGGAGSDVVNGGAGFDIMSYASATAGVKVDRVVEVGNLGDAFGDLLTSIEQVIGSAFNDDLRGRGAVDRKNGEDGNDLLIGRGSRDILSGGAGNDTLLGGNGDDDLEGGLGIDFLRGDGGIDRALYVNAASGVTVDMLDRFQNTGEATLDTVLVENIDGSDFDDDLRGDDSANVLRGRDGDDSLTGRGGDDTLEGGRGADVMTGGTGADMFLYTASNQGDDTIIDFATGTDLIGITGAAFGGLSAGALSAANFTIGANASDADDFFIYNVNTDRLFYDADGNGAGDKVLLAIFSGNPTLSAADIEIV